MAMIEFVRDYSDRSTDRGYQFEFRCDQCYSGFMSSFQPSFIGSAGGLLQAAGNIFGGILGSAGNSAYDIQRAVGGPAHDRALQQAVSEVKQRFRRCQRCGKWVCAEICWNELLSQCVACAPKYEQEVISLRTRAQVQATQNQMQEKADNIDYVSGIDMRPDAQVRFGPMGSRPALASEETGHNGPGIDRKCAACGTALGAGKFCSGCGAKVVESATCSGCGHLSGPSARFCEECGTKIER